jgi:hypothetical protein
VAITLRLGGRGWDGLGADVGVGTTARPGNAFGQLTLWAQEWLAELPLVGGVVEDLALRHLAGVLLAAAAVAASALVLGRWRTHWPPWAFLGLTGLLIVSRP